MGAQAGTPGFDSKKDATLAEVTEILDVVHDEADYQAL